MGLTGIDRIERVNHQVSGSILYTVKISMQK